MDTRREIEHFNLFPVFLPAGLVDMSSESLNFLNASNTEKQMYLYPKMASILEQNLRLKTLGYLLFIPVIFLSAVWLPHGQLLAIIEQTVSLTQC